MLRSLITSLNEHHHFIFGTASVFLLLLRFLSLLTPISTSPLSTTPHSYLLSLLVFGAEPSLTCWLSFTLPTPTPTPIPLCTCELCYLLPVIAGWPLSGQLNLIFNTDTDFSNLYCTEIRYFLLDFYQCLYALLPGAVERA